ncbi:MAG: 1-(5-phosphoribosyl)-5-[(5-phosphoribosylamino)methylideneamino] imidazole-4-carboxamide isomerase [Chloroflexota bacterium]|nr:1-(5-phosphoribosyl)-5-[(5-phosphoribosylamino)methylideneamino] imidazole-4-carboxamide isomerase [Chloroflexota bacterium]
MLIRYHGSTGRASFDVIPAIDLRGGRVVRLAGGDFARETAYAGDPVETAKEFAAVGAGWIHVVDLDGARQGSPVHGRLMAQIAGAVGENVRVEFAGGLRTAEGVAAALAAGAARVAIGTAALFDPGFAAQLVQAHGSARIAVALDVRDGLALGEGWRPGAAGLPPGDVLETLADAGVATFEVTSIARDGLMNGPDLELLARLVELNQGEVIASGGIRSEDDLAAVRSIGCSGAIVGRALYEGGLDLASALRSQSQSAETAPPSGPAEGPLDG